MSDLAPTTNVPQKEDDQKALLQRLLNCNIPQTTVALASAARTTNTASAEIDTAGYQFAFVVLTCTVASGTGGLTLLIRYVNPADNNDYSLLTATAALTATGRVVLVFGPGCNLSFTGASSSLTGGGSGVLPRKIKVQVNHGDGTSYTYSAHVILR